MENTIKIHEKLREILIVKSAKNVLNSINSNFVKWRDLKGIKQIITNAHEKATIGKAERFQQRMKKELLYCNNDFELFKYGCNHIKPHASLHMKTPAKIHFSLKLIAK